MREYGLQFDRVAEAYDRERPAYPERLLDAAFDVAGLAPGDPVLEVGCGTGKLTFALAQRGLDVVAVDPGASMIEQARGITAEFVQARFEDVELAEASFAAVFSASAFHWIDPEVGWAKTASLLAPGGTLVLLQYCGVSEPHTATLDLEFRRSLERIAPEVAAGFPLPRDARSLLAGASDRSSNVSEVWAWVSQHQLAVPDAAELYEDVRVMSSARRREWTAADINAQLRTTSVAFRLGPERTAALEAETERLLARLGGRIALTMLAVAVSARRAPG